MPTLVNLQKDFLAFLHGKHSHISQQVVAETPGLDIYKNAYSQRLREALDTDFPYLGLLLGDELYERLIVDYIDQMPSTDPSLRWFGSNMPRFLSSHPLFSNQPIVIEMADWEWQLQSAFDAENSTIVKLEQLATTSPEQWPGLQLELVPSLRTVKYQTNVVNIWQALGANNTPPSVSLSTNYWLIWRKELVTQFRSVPEDEWQIIHHILEGITFAEMCEQLCQWYTPEKAPQRAAQIMQQLMQDQLVKAMAIT